MKFILFFLCWLCLANPSFSQTEIKLDSVDKHVGDSVIVCGQVNDAYYASRIENTPTFLNIGGKYPNQKLTVVIWNDIRKEFEKAPEEMFKDQKICVLGRIELYKGKPQIVVRRAIQITVPK